MAKRVSSLGHRHTANDLTPFLAGSATISGAWTFNAGSSNTTVTIESSTGDAALYIKADTDNNNENDNPFIRFEQDANGVQLVIGTTGDGGVDAQGNTFTNCSANGASIHALYTSGSLALGVGGAVGLHIESDLAATFYGNVVMSGGDMTFDNGQELWFKDSGGTARRVFTLWTDDILYVGETGAVHANSYRGSSHRFDANVTIDTDGAGPMLDLGDGANADGTTFLRLNLDRTWSFKQSGTGAATALRLQTGTDNKLFHITDSGGTDRVSFNVSTTQNLNSARMPVLALVDGITAPSAVTGHAVLYVDTSDGDLKVRFADGTTKTIATDT